MCVMPTWYASRPPRDETAVVAAEVEQRRNALVMLEEAVAQCREVGVRVTVLMPEDVEVVRSHAARDLVAVAA